MFTNSDLHDPTLNLAAPLIAVLVQDMVDFYGWEEWKALDQTTREDIIDEACNALARDNEYWSETLRSVLERNFLGWEVDDEAYDERLGTPITWDIDQHETVYHLSVAYKILFHHADVSQETADALDMVGACLNKLGAETPPIMEGSES